MARLLSACFCPSQDVEVLSLSRVVKESVIHRLPVNAISQISQFLDITDVLSFAHTCSYLYSSVTQDNPLWERLCRQKFMGDELPIDGKWSWYTQWLYLCREFRRYRSCYAQVKSAWNQIESFLQERCPQAYSELMASGGVSEARLVKLERKLQMQLPDDYRCSLRFHGKLSVPLGSVKYLVHQYPYQPKEVNHQTFNLKAVNDVQFASIRPGSPEVHVKFVAIAENISSLPRISTDHELIFYCPHSSSKSAGTAKEFLLMVSSDEGVMCTGCPIGHVFTAFSSPIQYGWGRPGGCCPDLNRLYEWFRVVEAATFADWLSAEADRLQHYYINQQRQLTRFILKPWPWSEAVTGYFTARVGTVVLNTASGYDRRQTFAMCFIVELSENAQAEDRCLLEQVCLLIHCAQAPHVRSIVQNPPPQTTLCPGGVAEYLSMPFPTPEGVIQAGHIVMRTVQGRREVRVNLPQISFDTCLAKHFRRVR